MTQTILSKSITAIKYRKTKHVLYNAVLYWYLHIDTSSNIQYYSVTTCHLQKASYYIDIDQPREKGSFVACCMYGVWSTE